MAYLHAVVSLQVDSILGIKPEKAIINSHLNKKIPPGSPEGRLTGLEEQDFGGTTTYSENLPRKATWFESTRRHSSTIRMRSPITRISWMWCSSSLILRSKSRTIAGSGSSSLAALLRTLSGRRCFTTRTVRITSSTLHQRKFPRNESPYPSWP